MKSTGMGSTVHIHIFYSALAKAISIDVCRETNT